MLFLSLTGCTPLSFDAIMDKINQKITLSPKLHVIHPEDRTLTTTFTFDGKTKKMTLDPTTLAGLVPPTLTSIDISEQYEALKTLSGLFLQDDIIFLSLLDDTTFVDVTVDDSANLIGVTRIIRFSPTKAQQLEHLKSLNEQLQKTLPLLLGTKLLSSTSQSSTTVYLDKENHIIKEDITSESNGEVQVSLTCTLIFK